MRTEATSPCTCGSSERTAQGKCLPCFRIYNRKWMREKYRNDPAYAERVRAAVAARRDTRLADPAFVESERIRSRVKQARRRADAGLRRLDYDARNIARRFAKFGLSMDDAAAMLAEQGHRCVLSGRDLRLEPNADRTMKQVAVLDHCHECGALRGMLDARVNSALGFMGEDPAVLRAAADYIERHRAACKVGK